MTKYYLECESGVAGDMLVGALLDIGADEKKLMRVLCSLQLDDFDVEIRRVRKAGIDACDFNVILDEAHDGHDHDMAYLHGHEGSHHDASDHDHSHGEHHHDEDYYGAHEHHHGGNHHGEHEHSHAHRHLSDIEEIIDAGQMTDGARALAKRIFRIVAESEAKAHAMPVDEVHFHEVGAVDSIVDIVAIAVCADDLGIEGLIVPYLCEGQGTVRCQHGILPIPVPAVQNIAEAHQIPLKRIAVSGEFVTPTGAAAVAALRTEASLPSVYTVRRIGIGAGKRNYERASLIRLMELEETELENENDDVTSDSRKGQAFRQRSEAAGANADEWRDFVWKLETDIDDTTGERLGFLMQLLYDFGAREVHYAPVQMKKNRPGVELVVVCDEETREDLEAVIFTETTTIGIRRVRMERTVLPRREEEWNTVDGPLAVKIVELPNGQKRAYPEYESVLDMALRNKTSYADAWELAQQYIRVQQL